MAVPAPVIRSFSSPELILPNRFWETTLYGYRVAVVIRSEMIVNTASVALTDLPRSRKDAEDPR